MAAEKVEDRPVTIPWWVHDCCSDRTPMRTLWCVGGIGAAKSYGSQIWDIYRVLENGVPRSQPKPSISWTVAPNYRICDTLLSLTLEVALNVFGMTEGQHFDLKRAFPRSIDFSRSGRNHRMVYRMALNRSRTLSTDSNEAPAADTLREMREEMVTILKSANSEIEALMNQSLQYYALYKLGPEAGAKFTGKVTLNNDLTVDDFDKQLQIWAVARDDMKRVFVWYQSMLKKIAAEQKFSDEELEEINKAIDALKEEDVLNPLGVPGVGGVRAFQRVLNGNGQGRQGPPGSAGTQAAKATGNATGGRNGSQGGTARRAAPAVP